VANVAGLLSLPLSRAFAAIERAGLSWCLLRREGDDLDGPVEDTDILVARQDLSALHRVLRENGFALRRSFGRGTHLFFRAYDRATRAWITLDVVTEFGFGPGYTLRVPAAESCLAKSQRIGEVRLMAPGDRFSALLFHCVFDKGFISERYRRLLGTLAAEVRPFGGFADVALRVAPHELDIAGIIGLGEAARWDELEALAPRLRRHWLLRSGVRTILLAITRSLMRRAEPALLAVDRPGLMVALLGPDGAGKTSLAVGILRSYADASVRVVYMGLWSQGPDRSSGRAARAVASTLRPLRMWRRYLVGRVHAALGRIVVFDRYAYDAMLPRPHRGPLRRLYYAALSLACPAPDLAFVLDAPGEVMFARKGEGTPASLEQERLAFATLATRIRNCEVVDATRDPAMLVGEVVDRIWKQCADVPSYILASAPELRGDAP